MNALDNRFDGNQLSEYYPISPLPQELLTLIFLNVKETCSLDQMAANLANFLRVNRFWKQMLTSEFWWEEIFIDSYGKLAEIAVKVDYYTTFSFFKRTRHQLVEPPKSFFPDILSNVLALGYRFFTNEPMPIDNVEIDGNTFGRYIDSNLESLRHLVYLKFSIYNEINCFPSGNHLYSLFVACPNLRTLSFVDADCSCLILISAIKAFVLLGANSERIIITEKQYRKMLHHLNIKLSNEAMVDELLLSPFGKRVHLLIA